MSSTGGERKVPGLPREAYLYWIHCNRCFKLYVPKTVRLLLLACYHVFCEHCAPSSTADAPRSDKLSYKCPLPECSKMVRGRELNNMMPSHIKDLFHPHPWLDHLQPYVNIFQNEQRKRFASNILKTQRNLERTKSNWALARDLSKKAFEEGNQLSRERKAYEKRIHLVRKMRQQQSERATRAAALPMNATTTDESAIGHDASGGIPFRPHKADGVHSRGIVRSQAHGVNEVASFMHQCNKSFLL